jgi:translation initiation factor IF-2
MLVMTGTLRIGDIITVHNTYGRVRRMTDWTGNQVKVATGGDPVMILGIQDLPEPGRVAEVVNSDKEAQKKISAMQEHEQLLSKEAILQDIMTKIGQGDKVDLKLIMKADSFGSLEAAKHAAMQVALPENVELKMIHDDVGDVSDSDLTFAQAAGAIVI